MLNLAFQGNISLEPDCLDWCPDRRCGIPQELLQSSDWLSMTVEENHFSVIRHFPFSFIFFISQIDIVMGPSRDGRSTKLNEFPLSLWQEYGIQIQDNQTQIWIRSKSFITIQIVFSSWCISSYGAQEWDTDTRMKRLWMQLCPFGNPGHGADVANLSITWNFLYYIKTYKIYTFFRTFLNEWNHHLHPFLTHFMLKSKKTALLLPIKKKVGKLLLLHEIMDLVW